MKTVLLIIIGLLTWDKAIACKCLPVTFDEEANYSKYIFHGRVIEVNGENYTIDIIQKWKGTINTKTFRLSQGQTSCQTRTFELNKDYLFYLADSAVSNCSRTEEFERTIDPERLNFKFKGEGNLKSIEGVKLTETQMKVLKVELNKNNITYPDNLKDIDINYMNDTRQITKLDFFEFLWRDYSGILLTKDEKGKYYLWINKITKKRKNKKSRN